MGFLSNATAAKRLTPDYTRIARFLIDGADNRALRSADNYLTDRKAVRLGRNEEINFIRAVRADLDQARGKRSPYKAWPGVASEWFATDGTGDYYLFTRVSLSLAQPVGEEMGVRASHAVQRHGLRALTNSRPRGFVSAATLAAAHYGGLEGRPSRIFRNVPSARRKACDLDLAMADRIAREIDKNAGYQNGSLHDFAEERVR